MEKIPLVVIVGATAVGKTEFAIQLAERLDGEIISADSRLFYRGMDIGTAKPTPAERARVPHHLIDVADPDETWSLGRFQQEARAAIEDVHRRGRLPFLVGGTGQYIRAVIEGWQPPALAGDFRLRQWLGSLAAARGSFWLHEKLRRLDPSAAERIDPRNLRRTARALEVILLTGRRFSEQRRRHESPYHLLILGLRRPRAELYARIDARIEAMFQAGLLEETQRLLQQGYSPDLPSLSAIGYRECVAALQGKISLEEAKSLMRRATRRYVRHQANWFKESDPNIHWLEAGRAEALPQALSLIHDWLQALKNPR
uniref:tRNA dimethylallyltransferase n=1 Tax=uncultured Chloroflexota bacterium TaxID=166587 RepID=H5SPI6_9CHLR|nr:tRNA delta(2)-isopentenylpyrophosphate transferase [uncultured Chloroflexota bacterium]